MPGSWFHVSDGLFFRRAEDGAVEIGTGRSFDDVTVLQSIDANSWGSVVSSVSARGENHVTFHEALAFHLGLD